MAAEADARELFRNIRATAKHIGETLDAAVAELESLTELVIRAHDDRAWRSINHLSWEDCCKKEFGAIRLLRLPREMRKELHQAMRDGGLSVRHTAAVTGCSKNTVLQDCPAEMVSQTGTHEPDGEKRGTDAPDGEKATVADTPNWSVEHFNARRQPGAADLLGKVASAARAVSCDIANLASLAKLAQQDANTATEMADYLGPRVDAWMSTLGSLAKT